MIQTIKQALKTREVRRKLELMILTVFLVRVCAMFPVPGVDASVFKRWISSNANDALNLFSAFTGGSFENFSIFALGITPLITAQIIVQLLGVVLPPINRLQKQGEHGQKVLKMVTKMAALVLAFIQSLCMGIGFQKSGMITGGVFGIAMVTIFMTAGTAVMIWLSTVLTDKAIGEGTSILLMANIVSGFPKQFQSLIMNLTNGKELWVQAVSLVLAASLIIAIMVIIIYMSEGYHPLQVQYSQKMSQSGEDAQTGQIPVRVGIVSVMPIIFGIR
jgi:preprotein translocase subunit SecY